MSSEWKFVQQLTPADLQSHPVWEFVPDAAGVPKTAVRPVVQLPATDLGQRLVGTQIKLHNGTYRWAILSNISLRSQRATRHFLCVRIESNGRWFDLARYHDVDFERRGPSALAEFLHLSPSEIFPFEYDITRIAIGEPGVVKATVAEAPEERLTEDQIIELALEN